jgi:hypothetical protein
VLGDPERVEALAELLDLPRASELVSAQVESRPGPEVAWSALPEVVAACAVLRVAVPDGTLLPHPELVVRTTRPARGRHTVPAWRDADGRWHAADPVRALLGRLGDRRTAIPDG